MDAAELWRRLTWMATSTASETPGLSLTAALAAFNSNGRFFLWYRWTRANLTDLQCACWTRSGALWSKSREWVISRHAWVTMDYHLSWLHAALHRFCGDAWPRKKPPHLNSVSESGASWITGTQQYVDLIIGWTASPDAASPGLRRSERVRRLGTKAAAPPSPGER